MYVVYALIPFSIGMRKKTEHQNIEPGENKFSRRKYSTNSRCVNYIVVVAFVIWSLVVILRIFFLFIDGHNSDYHVEWGYLLASQMDCTLSSSLHLVFQTPFLVGHMY